MILETKRLILRLWKETDADDLYEFAKDPEVGPIAGWQHHTSPENSREIIKNVLNGKECYAICNKEDGRAIGTIELKLNGKTDMTDRDDECELGYALSQKYWGRGIMPEAARELIRHGFCDLKMSKIWCGYYDGNAKSKRVQEKLGFAYHHTCTDLFLPLMNETRTGHTNLLTKEKWLGDFTYRRLNDDEIPSALDLAERVFKEYETPVYPKEGTEEFEKCLADKEYLSGIEYYGAFYGGNLIGEIGIRKNVCHICFFFVDGKYHRLGIGTKLFGLVKNEYDGKTITLNSAPYGLKFYNTLGFSATDKEQTVNGIIFTPMIFNRNTDD